MYRAGRNMCFETAFYSGFRWWFLFPLPHQMDSWILCPTFPELSHHARLKLSSIWFNFYHFPPPLPYSPSWWCLLQPVLHTDQKLLWKYPSSPLPRGVKHNTKGKLKIFFKFKILWHSVCFGQSSWMKKFVQRMRGSIGITFDFLLGNA